MGVTLRTSEMDRKLGLLGWMEAVASGWLHRGPGWGTALVDVDMK